MRPTASSPDPEDIGHWDTLREGALDGATVRIYRIENGKFRLVSQDKVPSGGFHASSWLPVLPKDTVVAPDQAVFRFRWNEWNSAGSALLLRRVCRRCKRQAIADLQCRVRPVPAQAGKGEPINSTSGHSRTLTGRKAARRRPPA